MRLAARQGAPSAGCPILRRPRAPPQGLVKSPCCTRTMARRAGGPAAPVLAAAVGPPALHRADREAELLAGSLEPGAGTGGPGPGPVVGRSVVERDVQGRSPRRRCGTSTGTPLSARIEATSAPDPLVYFPRFRLRVFFCCFRRFFSSSCRIFASRSCSFSTARCRSSS